MKLDKIAGSGNDEYYTPEYAVQPILEFVDSSRTVWCPFDTGDSHFVKMLREKGCKVIATHLESGQDFFTYEPNEEYDFIISNPPYSRKTEVFERLFELGKPFAMLVGVVGLFESVKRFWMFSHNPIEILYMNRRISYFKDFSEQTPSINPPFSSVYLTSNFLPQQIVFRELIK